MNRKLTICACVTFSLLCGAVCRGDEVFPVVHGEPIAVRILNGTDGHPQAQTRVVLTAGYDRRDLKLAQWREELLTDSAGIVQLSNELRNLPLLQVEVLHRHGCAPEAEIAALSVERIRGSGMTGANRCGTAVVENTPGFLTVFVKGTKGKKNSSPSGLIAVLPVTTSKTTSVSMGAVTAPQAGVAASTGHATYESNSSKSILSDPAKSESGTSELKSLPSASRAHELPKPAAHEPASAPDAPENETEDTSQQNWGVQSAFGSYNMDPPPVAGPAPRSGQHGSRKSLAAKPAKQSPQSPKMNPSASSNAPTPSGRSASGATTEPAPASTPAPSARKLEGHADQSAGAVKASPAQVADSTQHPSGPMSAPSLAPVNTSTHSSASRIRRIDATNSRHTKTQPTSSVRPAATAANDRGQAQTRTPTAGTNRTLAASAAETHGSAYAAVRAASLAVSGFKALAPEMPSREPDSDSTSAPLRFRVRPAAPAKVPEQAPDGAPGEEDLNSMCEPG